MTTQKNSEFDQISLLKLSTPGMYASTERNVKFFVVYTLIFVIIGVSIRIVPYAMQRLTRLASAVRSPGSSKICNKRTRVVSREEISVFFQLFGRTRAAGFALRLAPVVSSLGRFPCVSSSAEITPMSKRSGLPPGGNDERGSADRDRRRTKRRRKSRRRRPVTTRNECGRRVDTHTHTRSPRFRFDGISRTSARRFALSSLRKHLLEKKKQPSSD